MDEQSGPVLAIDEYSLTYATARGPAKVLDGIDLTIGRGEVVGLVGESGSGKSTLAYAVMRALPGRVLAEAGSILFGGGNLRSRNEASVAGLRGNRIAMVFQDAGASLNPTLTLGRHFDQVLTRHRKLAKDAIRGETRRLMEMVGLPDAELMAAKYPHEVSGGEKQRAVLALAFACDPDLILFDEPTSALDATTAATILDLFRRLQERTGVSALFISHDLGVVSEISHRVAVIYAGRIVEVAAKEDLFVDARHPYTRALLASLPRPFATARGAALISLPGSLPDRVRQPMGCNFAPRCRYRVDECERHPVRLSGPEEHPVACIRWAETTEKPAERAGSPGIAADQIERGTAVLSVRGLTVRIQRPDLLARLLGRPPITVHAVTDVDFDLMQGETFGLVGESGCGKSTLARALTGLREFTGAVRLDGREITRARDIDEAYRRRVQIVFQNPDLSLNPRQTVATILSRPLKLYRSGDGAAPDRAIAALLEQVKLPADFATRYPHELSGGEKQRVAIARALGADPSIIICDEITSGLDASVQAAIVNLLRDIQRRRGVAYLFITHDLNLLRHIADRVAVMYLGQIVEQRSGGGLETSPYHPYTEALLSSAPVLEAGVEARRVRLEGAIPTRTGEVIGCPFASRCPRLIGDICHTLPVPRLEFNGAHFIRCHIDGETLRRVPGIWRADG